MRFLLGISPASETPGRYPKENALHIKHGESLKSRINKSLSLCESGTGSFRNKHAEQIIWAVICFVSSQQVLHSDVNRWTVFADFVIFLTLRAEVGLKAVTTSACSLRATEQVGLRLKASYSESVLSNPGRNAKYFDCGFSWYFTNISRWLPRNYLNLGRYRLHPCHFQFIILYFSSFLFWTLLPTHCRCRGLLLCPITRSVGLWTRDRPVSETSTWQHTFTTEGHPCLRLYSKPHTQQASGPRLNP